MVRKHFSLVCACAVVLIAAVPSKGAVTYDGRWWLSIDERHRGGFVDGFSVCYVNLVDHKLFRESIFAYRQRVTEYLQSHPDSMVDPIETTLLKLAGPPFAKPVHPPSTPNETSEEIAAKWGAHNDGDDWRGPDSWQLGYVEGFLECYSKHTKSEYGSFSKPPEWYVNAIANWYGTKADDPEAIDASRESEKIPEVLFRFRDKK